MPSGPFYELFISSKPESTMRISAILIVLMVTVAGPSLAQSPLTDNTLALDDSTSMPRASIHDLAWLAGHWRGEFLAGVADEVWAPPSAGSMMGMFRLVQDSAVVFYELMTIVEEGGTLVLKLKHFNPDLSGWEEKDDHVAFSLVRLGERAAYFEGLTFKRVAGDVLRGYLAMRRGDDVREAAFTYRLVATDASPIME